MNHARLSPEQRADDISWSYEDAELRSQDADRAHGPGCLDLMSLVCIQTLSRIQIIRSIKSNYKTSILKFAHSGSVFNRFGSFLYLDLTQLCLILVRVCHVSKGTRNASWNRRVTHSCWSKTDAGGASWNEIWSPDLYPESWSGQMGAQNCRGVRGQSGPEPNLET